MKEYEKLGEDFSYDERKYDGFDGPYVVEGYIAGFLKCREMALRLTYRTVPRLIQESDRVIDAKAVERLGEKEV